MKKLVLPLFLLLSATLIGQTLPKKYVLLEHFTNSRCSVCASKNPAFYNLIDDYPDDIHHIAYHPPTPYPNCVFYLANTTENAGRASVYGLNGTPRVAINGALAPVSGVLLPPALLTSEFGETSPISITVTETGSGVARTAKIKVKSWATVPSGNYRLFAAVVEKTVNQNTPNGESVHHDVFRKMLPALDGTAFQAPAVGQEIEFTFDYTIGAGWVADEVYVVAFIQDVSTKEVLNSGTRFDAPVTSAAAETAVLPLKMTPNPAQDQTLITLPGDRALSVEVYNSAGVLTRSVWTAEAGQLVLQTGDLSNGLYFVRIRGEKASYAGRLVKI